MNALGDFINGVFSTPHGEGVVTSRNPARGGSVVLEMPWSVASAQSAVSAAAAAAPSWGACSIDERYAVLGRFRDALAARRSELAGAVVLETGKLRSEAQAEVQSLLSRFDSVRDLVEREFTGGPLPGRPDEQLYYHPLGVVAVIGPFNYPLHLCHVHAVPALLLGNTVVIKPSEVTPLCGQLYAEAARDAGMPPGVFNLVHGPGQVGAALIDQPALRGLCFTGSWAVGRRIRAQTVDRPEILVALEMGGKNAAVVLDDADLRQAAHEIAIGGYLTTGQRCTATDRVLVDRSRAAQLIDILVPLVRAVRFGDPDDPDSFAGPLATESGRTRFLDILSRARSGGAEPLVETAVATGGFYVPATVHRLPERWRQIDGYTDVETFGPDVAIELVDGDDEAIAALNASPYSFANSIFTASAERFDRFYRGTCSGILNYNRSTNLASPQLPFGGIGRSGNHRPAGSHAPRNVVVPTAVQSSVLGALKAHPALSAALPPPDLDSLEARHEGEEAQEAQRSMLDLPRPMEVRRPAGGRLPESEQWLRRLYAGDRVVREKKPPVFDHLRSVGPWFVSIDDEPLSVLDAMSQTATMCGGFADDRVVRAYCEGEFSDALVANDGAAGDETEAGRAFADTLRELVPGLPHVAFVNSGAEATEKAFALCHAHARPGADKILAFEGGFHGRTLLSLHATHNPAKRARFELAGYQVKFAPFPVWSEPGDEPAAPPGFYAAAASAPEALPEQFGDPAQDPLLAAEVASLVAVHNALQTGEYFVVVVEPMQGEGGDRYATSRFFCALRLLTRRHQMSLVFDEVQTGFGLGGPFAWHQSFDLVTLRGQPDFPDAVCFAKRAQLGVVMSRFVDREATSVQTASLIRGRLHAEAMSSPRDAERIEKLVRPRLASIARAFPHLVAAPRARGFALAFDLPSPRHLEAYLGQRFWRGAITFGAGDRTVRYRLSTAFHSQEVRLLFSLIRRSLSWLDAHPNAPAPAWEDEVGGEKSPPNSLATRVRVVPPLEALPFLPEMLALEKSAYEPARRTPPADIRAALGDKDSVTVIAEVQEGGVWRFAGFALATPLERCVAEEGPDRDPMLGRENSLYSISVTVDETYQGLGLGRRLKEQQLREAARITRSDGLPRYRYVTSRNRVGRTAAMRHLNRVFGAHVVCVLTGQYEDPEGQAIYSRIPLPPYAPVVPGIAGAAARSRVENGRSIELSAGPAQPLARPPAALVAGLQRGVLFGPAINKITLMNYATPAVVRALEWLAALFPQLPHLYLTSSRDETVDKSLRILRWHRPEARIAIGLDGGYVGHTTAAARSISDPSVHRQGPPYFAWPRVPHPAMVGTSECMRAIRACIDRYGAAQIFALYYEVVQERTGLVIPDDFWPELAAIREHHGLPLVAVETATAMYRSGRGPFAHSGASLLPDLLLWWGGGQVGYVHATSRLFVDTPLTMVSTWDGDELSLVREYHQLRAARRVEVPSAAAALDAALDAARQRGICHGMGLYRVLHAGERVAELEQRLAAARLRARALPGGRIVIAPPLDCGVEAARRLGAALATDLS